MDILNSQFTSIEQISGQYLKKKFVTERNDGKNIEVSFEDMLKTSQLHVEQKVQSNLKFSKHANERVESRHINLSNEVLQRLESGTKIAQQKGIKDSLVMIDNVTFIVNTKSNTVVTAVKDNDTKVFTNIDGAVIA